MEIGKIIYIDGKKTNGSIDLLDKAEEIFIKDPETVHAFTEEHAKHAWLVSNGFDAHYKRGLEIIRRSKRNLSDTEEKKLAEFQAKVEIKGRKKVDAIIKKAGLSHKDSKGLRTIIEEYDPLRGPIVHSAFIYQHKNFGGQWRYIENGWAFPKFSWIGFNDMASSVRVFAGTLILYEHTWYNGRSVWTFGYPYAHRTNLADINFNDMVSSAALF